MRSKASRIDFSQPSAGQEELSIDLALNHPFPFLGARATPSNRANKAAQPTAQAAKWNPGFLRAAGWPRSSGRDIEDHLKTMKNAIVILGLAVMGQTFVATGFAQTKDDKGSPAKTGTVDHATPGAASHPRFEYRVASPAPTETEEQALNKLGEEGWELVAVVGHEDSKRATYYLKRVIRK